MATRIPSLFSGDSTALKKPPGFVFGAEAVVRNFCGQFLTFASLPMLKRLNILCFDITQSFLKHVSGSSISGQPTSCSWRS
jgi:hypothetical protein